MSKNYNTGNTTRRQEKNYVERASPFPMSEILGVWGKEPMMKKSMASSSE